MSSSVVTCVWNLSVLEEFRCNKVSGRVSSSVGTEGKHRNPNFVGYFDRRRQHEAIDDASDRGRAADVELNQRAESRFGSVGNGVEVKRGDAAEDHV